MPRKRETDQGKEKASNVSLALTVAVVLVVAVAIFFVTPMHNDNETVQHRTEGILVQLSPEVFASDILLGTSAVISMLKDVKAAFKYHGREHKAVINVGIQRT